MIVTASPLAAPHAFADQTDVAELFGRHASLAIRTVTERAERAELDQLRSAAPR